MLAMGGKVMLQCIFWELMHQAWPVSAQYVLRAGT